MSKELQELEDKLLFDEVNRRLELLAIVQGKQRHFDWYRLIFLIPLGGLACIFARDAFAGDEIVALLLIVTVMLSLNGIYEETANARMNALVKLLQEDDILRDTPPNVKHSERS